MTQYSLCIALCRDSTSIQIANRYNQQSPASLPPESPKNTHLKVPQDMPLGWYLAQGLYPVGPSSSDDEEGPCDLPDGRVVCGPHGLVICPRCCTDYSFMDDVLGDSEDEDDIHDSDIERMYNELSPEARARIDSRGLSMAVSADSESTDDLGLRRGTGRVIPTRFFPPSESITPLELFSGRARLGSMTRLTHRNDPTKCLIFTDGACLNNGQPNPRAGWAFHHGILPSHQPAIASGRLERKGPFHGKDDKDSVQSSNRAELRAIIAALRFRHWPGENFQTIVIATDSAYAVDGATKWCKTWVKNGWKTSSKADVKNKDLWETLLGEAERAKDNGLAIHLWQIPREWNTIVDAAAKEVAAEENVPEHWREVLGMVV